MQVFRTKTVEQSLEDAEQSDRSLRRELGPIQLSLLGIGVIVLRRTRPDLNRPFRTPLVSVLPILSVLASLWLMLNLQSSTWIRFAVWLAIGLVVYFGYSRRRSGLAGRETDDRAASHAREGAATRGRASASDVDLRGRNRRPGGTLRQCQPWCSAPLLPSSKPCWSVGG